MLIRYSAPCFVSEPASKGICLLHINSNLGPNNNRPSTSPLYHYPPLLPPPPPDPRVMLSCRKLGAQAAKYVEKRTGPTKDLNVRQRGPGVVKKTFPRWWWHRQRGGGVEGGRRLAV